MNTAAFTRKSERASLADVDAPVDLTRDDCKLLAMQQFTCTYVPYIRIDCKPLWRAFAVCAGKSFEVTQYTVIDEATGQASLKSGVVFKPGKSWHDIQGGF